MGIPHCRGARSASPLSNTLSSTIVATPREDEVLYPRLFAHADADVRAKADLLHGEVGDLYQSVGAYLERWPTSQAISGNAPEFARETFDVLRALGRRMKCEDRELYPLVDAHE